MRKNFLYADRKDMGMLETCRMCRGYSFTQLQIGDVMGECMLTSMLISVEKF